MFGIWKEQKRRERKEKADVADNIEGLKQEISLNA